MLTANQIPNVEASRFMEIAMMTDVNGNAVTSLTPVLMNAKGADQMSFSQTLALFSPKV